jgi:hypothetical protein
MQYHTHTDTHTHTHNQRSNTHTHTENGATENRATEQHTAAKKNREQYTHRHHVLYRAYDAATIRHIFAGPTRTSRTCRPAPRSPLPSHHTHAHRYPTRQDPRTKASQRHGAGQRTPTSYPPHIAHSRIIQNHMSRTPARRPAQPQPLRTAQISQHAHAAAHTPHTARHTALSTPHTAHRKHTQSHTRPSRHTHDSRVRLPSVDGMLPESWLPNKYNCLQDTRTAITSYHNT